MEEIKEKAQATIAEMTDGIILASFEKRASAEASYQTEALLEKKLIDNLISQGYEKLDAHSSDDLYKNLKIQIEKLNNIEFSESEWARFLKEYLDSPSDTMIEKTRKVQENYIYDFTFDDGSLKNIKIIDKKHLNNNFLQVVNQVVQIGECKNIYDVSILVNGLPLVHIELKKRGVSLAEAFNQIHRYSKESFNSSSSLYKYVEIFIISNGTFTRYFANTIGRDKNNFQFTCEWADAKNRVIRDLEDFTKTFLEKRVLLEVLTKYCVFDVDNRLMIMRPYQIAAAERILWKIKSSYENKKAGSLSGGGFIWHTTGSGKTLTSFKASRLATELDFIDKVFFVVDRKDLDYQTMREYQKYQSDCVNGSKDAKELKKNIEKEDDKIVVTTIQKLNEFVKSNKEHAIYSKHCVLIFDECHRSQFGKAQKNIRAKFKKDYQFGFTGTPIFPENSFCGETTAGIFGAQLHSYVITDAIRDGKVLKFLVDYTNVVAKFRKEEAYDATINKKELKQENLLLHPERIESITKYILKRFNDKTHRNGDGKTIAERREKGFNAMFAVESIRAAMLYYEEFTKQQALLAKEDRLRVVTIYSFAPNEEQASIGSIEEENFKISALNSSAKEFLQRVIKDYNECFKTNFSVNDSDFQNYYKDVAKKVKDKEVDLLIVVGMFLTGFDAPSLNTLFVDKSLRYHGLLQAFSRTNRILNNVKSAGNIVCFRNLEEATKDAIKTFGDANSIKIILERSYKDYIDGFKDEKSEMFCRGFKEICEELQYRFPEPNNIKIRSEKKAFVGLFSEFLRVENILKNFDAFDDFPKIISDRQLQDMKSAYIAIREESLKEHNMQRKGCGDIDFSDIEFQIDLLKTEETTLDFIITLILEKFREKGDIGSLKDEIARLIRSNFDLRAKESLVIDFINETNLNTLATPEDVLDAFYSFARDKKASAIVRIIEDEKLKDGANRFIEKSINKGYVETEGDEFDNILPPTSRRDGKRETKKRGLLARLKELVAVFVGI